MPLLRRRRSAASSTPPLGWNLTDAVIGDIGGYRATPIAITAGALTYSKLSDYAVLWFGSTSQNAMQFDVTTNPTTHLAIASGASGASAFGSYFGASIAFRVESDGNVGVGALTALTGPTGNAATRFRLAILAGIVRLEYWNGSAWALDLTFDISAQAALTAGYIEAPRLGVVVNASSSVDFANIKVGTYTE